MKRGTVKISSSFAAYDADGNNSSRIRRSTSNVRSNVASAPVSVQTALSNSRGRNDNKKNNNAISTTRIRRRRRKHGPLRIPSVVTLILVSLALFLAAYFSITALFLFNLEEFESNQEKEKEKHHEGSFHINQLMAPSSVLQNQRKDKESQTGPTSSGRKTKKPGRQQLLGSSKRTFGHWSFLSHHDDPTNTTMEDFHTVRQRETVGIVLSRSNDSISMTQLSEEAPHNSTEQIDMRQMSATFPFANEEGGVWKQGWDLQPRALSNSSSPDDVLQIIVVPHSHCDPGWIKTFDDYFRTRVKRIITSVIEALEQDQQRTFIWAEISYFSWWWEEQRESKRQSVRRLLERKQLEFVTGGWVQPDEANSNWDALEIQMQEGFDWIEQNIGPEFLPKYGWSIDPFGYSPTLPYMLKTKFGFEGILIQRVHYAVKKALAERKHLEFYWRQTWDDSGEYDMFTHLMPFFSYDVPHTCGPDPSICCQFDFARTPLGRKGTCPWKKPPRAINPYNVKERSMTLLDQYLKKADLYRGKAVLIPLGDDFRYQSTREAMLQYRNYQRLFDYINKNMAGVHIRFGTLSQYFETIRGKFTPPILKGSFFTYSDANQDYWSGYFTSRVFDKALDRQLERVVYAATSLGASRLELQMPRRQLSLFQHHDGVTGTAKTSVVKDYAQRMYNAIKTTQNIMLQKLQGHNSELATQMSHTNVSDPTNDPESEKIEACWQSDGPRGLSENLCRDGESVFAYNPLLDTVQSCGSIPIEGGQVRKVTLPCEDTGPLTSIEPQFHNVTGMMTWPIQEQWLVWVVKKGGAYLFIPDHSTPYKVKNATVKQGGYVVETEFWRRTVIERFASEDKSAMALDFVYEINLQEDNREWFVRFSTDIQSKGIFYTDLNGFNFDTHHRRRDLPIQSQVFPMPAHAAIQDSRARLTVLSEHAQGTASLEDGAIDVFLDRRLNQDDQRGLGQGVQDNVATRTRFRLVLEREGFDTNDGAEFQITPFCRREWNQLNHPLEFFGQRTKQQLEHHISMETIPPKTDPPRGSNGFRRQSTWRRRHIFRRQSLGQPDHENEDPDPEGPTDNQLDQNEYAAMFKSLVAKDKVNDTDEKDGTDDDAQLDENERVPPGYAAIYADIADITNKHSNRYGQLPPRGTGVMDKGEDGLPGMDDEIADQYRERVKDSRQRRVELRHQMHGGESAAGQ